MYPERPGQVFGQDFQLDAQRGLGDQLVATFDLPQPMARALEL